MSSALAIAEDELDHLFADFLQHDGVLLAVSGGRDSIALLILAARWVSVRKRLGQKHPTLHAITIDHGLRAEAQAEATFVSTLCLQLEIPHSVRRVAGDPPDSGLQEWARDARYTSLHIAALATGCTAIVTGHQADDQAEVVLMRLARGSGLDGLAAMSRHRSLIDRNLLRPLLHMPRARLTATLQAEGVTWIDDPSNTDTRFERSAFGVHTSALEALGLTPKPLVLSAQRLQEAREGLEWATDQAIGSMPECLAALTAGYAVVPCAAYDPLPRDIRRRLITKCLNAVSGDADAPRLERVEALIERLRHDTNARANKHTLGGCLIARDADSIMIFREAGRSGFPVLSVRPGTTKTWDRRFRVAVPTALETDAEVRALCNPPENAAQTLQDVRPADLPAPARAALPSFWHNDQLLAVPHLGYACPPYEVRVNAAATGNQAPNSASTSKKRTFSAVAVPTRPRFIANNQSE